AVISLHKTFVGANMAFARGRLEQVLAAAKGKVQEPELSEEEKKLKWVEETRVRWRKTYARRHEELNQLDGTNPNDVSFTRWLCPTGRVMERQEHHGIRPKSDHP
ncbi:unnamed protein product, partial [Durusdinium trenchii]